jgi:uncharacterized oligopeptide transporter (OPT) family protein
MHSYVRAKVAVIVGSVTGLMALVVPALAGATADPVLTDAKTQATSYFSDNIAVVVGGFILVAGALWLLALAFNSMGLKRKRSI